MMKRFLMILVVGLLWGNVGFSKGISGTQLLCESPYENPVGFWFLSEVFALEYTIHNWEVTKYEQKVAVNPDTIHVGRGDIDRETLRYLGTEYYDCSIVKDFNFEEYFNKLLKDQIAEQEEKNKL